MVLLRDSYYVGWREGEHAEVLVVKRYGVAYPLPRRPNCSTDSKTHFDWGNKSNASLYLAWCILCDFQATLAVAEQYRVAFRDFRLLSRPREGFVMSYREVNQFLTEHQARDRVRRRAGDVIEETADGN